MNAAPDPLVTLRLFADMRQARLVLRGLDTPDVKQRARMICRPHIYKALCDLLLAAEKLVAGPDENALFWHPERETLTEAELRFEQLRQELAP
jgi:hypothetical protein